MGNFPISFIEMKIVAFRFSLIWPFLMLLGKLFGY